MSEVTGAPVVDVFCGAGGLAHGFGLAGFRVVAGIDLDPACQYPFAHNNPDARFIQKDVRNITPDELRDAFGPAPIRILAGCAPCQPFSSFARGRDPSGDETGRWNLLDAFANLVVDVVPEVVTMENVTRLAAHSVYSNLIERLEKVGYYVSPHIVHCPDYGVPQTRRRLVVLASTLGPIRLIPPTHSRGQCPTVRMTIGHLDPIAAGEVSANDWLHRASSLSSLNLARIRSSRAGGSWRDWDDDLRAACHTKDSGKTYPGVYGRMKWDELAPTITTQFFTFGTGRFGHPEQDRAISLREGALLQTFPQDYEFVSPKDPVHIKVVGRLIGNAVPVLLGRAIAKSIEAHLKQHRVE